MTAGIVHHRNHDTADCRRENLELVTPIDNTRQAQQKPGASGYVGVRRRSVNDHWQFEALVVRRGRKRKWSRRLGCYPTAFLAAVARALFLIGHPRWLAVSYTPTKRDEPPWKMAKALAADETLTDLGVLELLANHKKFRRLLRFARLQVSKGRAVQVRGRDGGH